MNYNELNEIVSDCLKLEKLNKIFKPVGLIYLSFPCILSISYYLTAWFLP